MEAIACPVLIVSRTALSTKGEAVFVVSGNVRTGLGFRLERGMDIDVYSRVTVKT